MPTDQEKAQAQAQHEFKLRQYMQILQGGADSASPGIGSYAGLVGALGQERNRITQGNQFNQAAGNIPRVPTKGGNEMLFNNLARGLTGGLLQGMGAAQSKGEYKDYVDRATNAPLAELKQDPEFTDVAHQREIQEALQKRASAQAQAKMQEKIFNEVNKTEKYQKYTIGPDGQTMVERGRRNPLTGFETQVGDVVPQRKTEVNIAGETPKAMSDLVRPVVKKIKQDDGSFKSEISEPNNQQLDNVTQMMPHFADLTHALWEMEKHFQDPNNKETDMSGDKAAKLAQNFYTTVLKFAQATGRGANFTKMEQTMIKGMIGVSPAGALTPEDVIGAYKGRLQGRNPLKRIRTTLFRTLRGIEVLAGANAQRMNFNNPYVSNMYDNKISDGVTSMSQADFMKSLGDMTGGSEAEQQQQADDILRQALTPAQGQ